MKNPIIAMTVAFAVLVGQRISSTVTTVECVLIEVSTTITTARVESTNQTAPFAKNSSSVQEVPLMKCHADMPFIGSVSGSWQHMILVVRFVKRLPRQGNE